MQFLCSSPITNPNQLRVISAPHLSSNPIAELVVCAIPIQQFQSFPPDGLFKALGVNICVFFSTCVNIVMID
jgi:hypothetical protein